MIYTGLVSVTFRQLTPDHIIELVAEAGLTGIEWGGDVHIPPTDPVYAKHIAAKTRSVGLQIASYGSYYRVGCHSSNTVSFENVLKTAEALGAPVIRVWAGDIDSAQADETYWNYVIEDSRRIADMAYLRNIRIAYEFHKGTLTDTPSSARKLLAAVNRPNVRCYWQPPIDTAIDERLCGLKQMLPWIENIHVFHWTSYERLPLADGIKEWKQYLTAIAQAGGNHFAMLEFVKGDDPNQFLEDAKTLKKLINI